MCSACKAITSNSRTAFTGTAPLLTRRHCGRSTPILDPLLHYVVAQIIKICVGVGDAFNPLFWRGVSFALKSPEYTSRSSMVDNY
jgi:hypothetical protein